METRQIIDWEHAVKEKIESCKGKYGFPNAGDFGVTDKEVADYVYDKQRILDREDDRRKHLAAYRVADIGIYPLTELLEVLFLERQPCRIDVPAEILEQVGTTFNGAIQVEPLHAPCRASDQAV